MKRNIVNQNAAMLKVECLRPDLIEELGKYIVLTRDYIKNQWWTKDKKGRKRTFSTYQIRKNGLFDVQFALPTEHMSTYAPDDLREKAKLVIWATLDKRFGAIKTSQVFDKENDVELSRIMVEAKALSDWTHLAAMEYSLKKFHCSKDSNFGFEIDDYDEKTAFIRAYCS